MKALIYEKAHSLEDFAIHLAELPEPSIRELDVLVEIRAIGVNPGEAFIRQHRSAEAGGHILLGWEFAGTVVNVGPGVQSFKKGDRVYGTGDMTRDGAWAERVAVDHRIIAKIPDELSFVDAASLPIGAVTAWEALFRDQGTLPVGVDRVLIVGGAGGVGSLATQLLKARTKAFVITTASRPESQEWCEKMGADLVVDHTKDVASQLVSANIQHLDMVLSTAGTSENISWIAKLLRPFGHVSVVDMAPSLDLGVLAPKSASLHMEMVFSRVLSGIGLETQGCILETVADLVTLKRLHPIATTRLEGLTVETMKEAHQLIETRRTVGKVVIVT
jgi:NADPH2:quinone reductase